MEPTVSKDEKLHRIQECQCETPIWRVHTREEHQQPTTLPPHPHVLSEPHDPPEETKSSLTIFYYPGGFLHPRSEVTFKFNKNNRIETKKEKKKGLVREPIFHGKKSKDRFLSFFRPIFLLLDFPLPRRTACLPFFSC